MSISGGRADVCAVWGKRFHCSGASELRLAVRLAPCRRSLAYLGLPNHREPGIHYIARSPGALIWPYQYVDPNPSVTVLFRVSVYVSIKIFLRRKKKGGRGTSSRPSDIAIAEQRIKPAVTKFGRANGHLTIHDTPSAPPSHDPGPKVDG